MVKGQYNQLSYIYLQQFSGLAQTALVHFCPFGQWVHVAYLATFLWAGTLAITDVAAKMIASTLKLIFFMMIFFKMLNN